MAAYNLDRLKPGLSFIKNIKSAFRTEWLEQQSFCFQQQNSAVLSPILTLHGLCYSFNLDEDIFDQTMWVQKFWAFLKIFKTDLDWDFSVSKDFLSNDRIHINCSDRDIGISKKRLTIDSVDELNQYCRNWFYSVIVQESTSFPASTKLKLSRASSVKYILKPKIYTTDEALRKISPTKRVDQILRIWHGKFIILLFFYRRDCIFEDERKLKYFNKYTKENCIQECKVNATIHICDCVPYFYIRENLLSMLDLRFYKLLIPGDEEYKICNDRLDFDCYDKVIIAIHDEESEAFKSCGCLHACNSIEYNFDIYYENIKNQTADGNTTRSSLSIYFADDEFIVLKRYASFGTVTLLSNIGGLLGLFLGVSVLSLVEVFYYFVIRLINNLWWKETY